MALSHALLRADEHLDEGTAVATGLRPDHHPPTDERLHQNGRRAVILTRGSAGLLTAEPQQQWKGGRDAEFEDAFVCLSDPRIQLGSHAVDDSILHRVIVDV